MRFSLSGLMHKYPMLIKGVLHVGAGECKELIEYERYVSRDKILWIEAIPEKVSISTSLHSDILIENAVVSDVVEDVTFTVSSKSSSLIKFNSHTHHYSGIEQTSSFKTTTSVLSSILPKYDISFNFLNLNIQQDNIKALKGMESYLPTVDCVYTSVTYESLKEVDTYLREFGLVRVETTWSLWDGGDAFYIRPKN